MERAITHLAQKPDSELFEVLTEGLGHIYDSISRLMNAASALDQTMHAQAKAVLLVNAEEEAAKVLILLDMIRCPRKRSEDRGRVLGFYYDHLAKGIYVEICQWLPADFDELSKAIERECSPYYLDGPNGVDWVFPNDVLLKREAALYVDYVQESGEEGSHTWIHPKDPWSLLPVVPSTILDLVTALHKTNLLSVSGMKIISETWDSTVVKSSMTGDELSKLNYRILKEAEDRGVFKSITEEQAKVIISRWPFPLYPLNIKTPNKKIKEEKRKELRERQRSWTPDW